MSVMMNTFHCRESPLVIVPSTAGYAAIIPPIWRGERSTQAEMNWERRWQAEWDRRNVED